MNIALVGINFPKECSPYIEDLLGLLSAHNHTVFIVKPFYTFLRSENTISKDYNCSIFTKDDALPKIDFFFSIGGDGTFLETITYAAKSETPILGINTGRMGFLATIPRDKIREALNSLHKNQYTIDARSLLEIEMEGENIFGSKNFALNEISLSKRDTSSMITVHAKIDGEFLNVYWADGLILSTPTGSTGYSLSCGGPIMMPTTSNFILAPINPHNLTARPLIVSDESIIELYVETRSKNYLLTLDSRSMSLEKSIVFKIKKAPFKSNLININNNTYIETLKNKLNWGYDVRN